MILSTNNKAHQNKFGVSSTIRSNSNNFWQGNHTGKQYVGFYSFWFESNCAFLLKSLTHLRQVGLCAFNPAVPAVSFSLQVRASSNMPDGSETSFPSLIPVESLAQLNQMEVKQND